MCIRDRVITDEEIIIKVLESIDEYYSEGKAQNICVFGSEYYKNCLLYTSQSATRRKHVPLCNNSLLSADGEEVCPYNMYYKLAV